MIKIKFERYWNDYHRKNETKDFSSLSELEEWIFGQMQRDYSKNDYAMSFPTPEKAARIVSKGPWAIEFTPKRGEESIWIKQIENYSGIIFSDGTFTSGQKHWNKDIQEWLTHCDSRKRNPQFNFAE